MFIHKYCQLHSVAIDKARACKQQITASFIYLEEIRLRSCAKELACTRCLDKAQLTPLGQAMLIFNLLSLPAALWKIQQEGVKYCRLICDCGQSLDQRNIKLHP